MEEQQEHRRHLVEALHAASQDFDRAIMTLAAGALGLSIVFVHNVAPEPKRTSLLGWSWGLFAFSLLAIVISFLTSQAALRWEIDHFTDRERGEYPGGNAGRATSILNIAAGGSFILGVLTLAWFAFVNL